MLIHPEVSDALGARRPVVALESTIISHGLPRPDNLRIAREIEASVRDSDHYTFCIEVDGDTGSANLHIYGNYTLLPASACTHGTCP